MSHITETGDPQALAERLAALRDYLTATRQTEAIALLDRTLAKAKTDADFARRMAQALLHGSTVERRTLFSVFGDYMAITHDDIPRYRHHDAVNGVDSALFHLRLGDADEAIALYNFLHH